jgi:ABC-type nickel/cobalt efflux system permease component RcnA
MSAISTLTTLGLGALHALEPGHGKAFLATYAIGNELNRKRH